tara:strand:- start:1953 stop:2471 length:519 start_codon:yes stop_codon:yes gene_type:complete
MNNLIFVGGIHGVGKGTFCKKVLSKTNSIHLSCSNLIKWTEISSIQNKKVTNINETQERLILGLEKAIENNNKYILDGHFCLLNKENIISNVPFETFEKINPKGIIIISEEVEVIFKRLNLRDNLSYSIELLQGFQDREIARAKEVAKKLKVELFIFKNNFNEALNFIDKKL